MTALKSHRAVYRFDDDTYWIPSWNQYEPSPHGTPARYRNGCDCPLCLDGEARANRRRRNLEVDVLLVECACGQRNIRVPEEDVRNGIEHHCYPCRKAERRRNQARRLQDDNDGAPTCTDVDRTDVPRETGPAPLSHPSGKIAA
mgnify:CR=1 FL=1